MSKYCQGAMRRISPPEAELARFELVEPLAAGKLQVLSALFDLWADGRWRIGYRAANLGARRPRSFSLGVVPRDPVVGETLRDAAYERCLSGIVLAAQEAREEWDLQLGTSALWSPGANLYKDLVAGALELDLAVRSRKT